MQGTFVNLGYTMENHAIATMITYFGSTDHGLGTEVDRGRGGTSSKNRLESPLPDIYICNLFLLSIVIAIIFLVIDFKSCKVLKWIIPNNIHFYLQCFSCKNKIHLYRQYQFMRKQENTLKEGIWSVIQHLVRQSSIYKKVIFIDERRWNEFKSFANTYNVQMGTQQKCSKLSFSMNAIWPSSGINGTWELRLFLRRRHQMMILDMRW